MQHDIIHKPQIYSSITYLYIFSCLCSVKQNLQMHGLLKYLKYYGTELSPNLYTYVASTTMIMPLPTLKCCVFKSCQMQCLSVSLSQTKCMYMSQTLMIAYIQFGKSRAFSSVLLSDLARSASNQNVDPAIDELNG